MSDTEKQMLVSEVTKQYITCPVVYVLFDI